MASPSRQHGPTVQVVGLGPAGPDLVPPVTRALLAPLAVASRGHRAFLRTRRHPAAEEFSGVPSLDHCYEDEPSFDAVYRHIVEELVRAASESGDHEVVYAVPGSPLVAEDTVAMLRADERVAVVLHPALSFLDLAWLRLGIDPLVAGVTLVDAMRFAESAAGRPGPLLVAQCWSSAVLSEIKLAAGDGPAPEPVTVLRHLGLADEEVSVVAWDDVDRVVRPDHLTSLYVPQMAPPVAGELVALEELTRTLRERCPWDAQQTHGSLARHLLAEAYEALDALETLAELDALAELAGGARGRSGDAEQVAVEHVREELGDLLFQIHLHARLAAEEGRFTMADVAAGIREKLVARHPHVFGDAVAGSAGDVAAGWEVAKLAEKGRDSVTDGIPSSLPALSLAGELLRKAPAAGVVPAPWEAVRARASALLGTLPDRDAGDGAETGETGEELLLAVAELVRRSGADPELSLRRAAGRLRDRIRAAEGVTEGVPGKDARER